MYRKNGRRISSSELINWTISSHRTRPFGPKMISKCNLTSYLNDNLASDVHTKHSLYVKLRCNTHTRSPISHELDSYTANTPNRLAAKWRKNCEYIYWFWLTHSLHWSCSCENADLNMSIYNLHAIQINHSHYMWN